MKLWTSMQIVLKLLVVALLILARCPRVGAQTSPDPDGFDWRLAVEPEELMLAVGFWHGQRFTLDRIEHEFEDLRRRSNEIALMAELRFRPAVDAINEHARTRIADWDVLMNKTLREADAALSVQEIVHEDAEAFLTEVERRLAGDIPSPSRELLFAFNPAYVSRPAKEISDGIKRVYRSDTEPKACGLKLAVEYPASWVAQPGQRPHIVQTIRAQAGHGTASAVLYVRDIPEAERPLWTSQAIRDLASPESLAQDMPDARLLERGTTRMAGQFASWNRFIDQRESIVGHVKMLSWAFHFEYEGRYVCLQFIVSSVASEAGALQDDDALEAKFELYRALFLQMANSVDIMNRYDG